MVDYGKASLYNINCMNTALVHIYISMTDNQALMVFRNEKYLKDGW